MVVVTDYWIINCESDGIAVRPLRSRLADLERRIPSRYRSLTGLVAWQEGTVLSRIGMSNEAWAAFHRALLIFEALGENDNRAYMLNAVSAMDADLGRTAQAWMLRPELFQAASRSGKPALLQMALDTTARSELAAKRLDTAHVLFSAAASIEGGNPRLRFDATLWRTLTAERLGRHDQAADALSAARLLAAKIKDAGLRASVDNDLRLAEALATPITTRTALLTVFIEDAVRRDDRYHLPEAWLERGRARRASGDLNGARSDFTAALQALSVRAERIGEPDVRDTFFGTFDDVVQELVDLIDRAGSPVKALDEREQWRVRAVADSADGRGAATTAMALCRRLPRGIVVLDYLVLSDRLLLFSLSERGVRVTHMRTTRTELTSLTTALTSSLQTGKPYQEQAKRLYHILMEPVQADVATSDTLVLVVDAPLDGLPFCALLDPADQRFLVEKASLVYAPTITAFAARLGGKEGSERITRALIVGNPRTDPTLGLAPLPAATREAREIAAMYGVTPLVDERASKGEILSRMHDVNLVHIGSHSVVNGDHPHSGFLALSPSGDDGGALYVHELARLRLANLDVAVVAGCRTGGAVSSSEALTSIALAFIAAGAKNTIASMWDIDDDVAPSVFHDLHRRLQLGARPAAALRETQLALLHSRSPRFASPATWSGLRLYGGR